MYKISIIAACLQLAVGASALGRRMKKKGDKIFLVVHKPGAWRGFMGAVFIEEGRGALGSTSQAER